MPMDPHSSEPVSKIFVTLVTLIMFVASVDVRMLIQQLLVVVALVTRSAYLPVIEVKVEK